MKVGIIAATGKSIGLGHLTRCLSIAGSLEKLAHSVEFILDNDYFSNWILKFGFSYKKSDEENSNYDIIIIDKYDINRDFLDSTKRRCNILARIDDAYPLFEDKISDILINCNPYAKEELYEGLLRQDCQLILGANYVPMDDKFCLLRNQYRLRSKIRNVTLTFGGSQDISFVKNICERIQTKKNMNIYVLNGTILKNVLSESATSKLHLLPLIDNIEDVFLLSDLVICSASTTCWQLCASGIPFICFKTADNQKYNFDYIKNTKVGVALENDAIDNNNLESEINDLDWNKRKSLQARGRQSIDCRGAGRIASRLSEIIK
jgi:spore coat polysaccharide biosynthesis predicted glycosyltransferase SpsG